MRAWQAAFGDSERVALVPPILFGAALVPLAWHVGTRWFDRRTGLIAAALVALSPPLILFSAAVRPYSLLPLLCLASCHALLRGVQNGGRVRWSAYTALTLAMLLTHNWAWLVWAAQAVVVAAWPWRGVRSGPRVARRGMGGAAVAAGYAFWLPAFLHQAGHAGHGRGGSPRWPSAGSFLEATIGLPRAAAAIVLAGLVGAWMLRRVRSGAERFAGPAGRGLAASLLIGVPAVALAAAIALLPKTNLLQNAVW